MDEQSGESNEEEVIDEGLGESEIEDLVAYQNEVDEEIKRVDSREMVKYNERSNQLGLLLERMLSVDEQE